MRSANYIINKEENIVRQARNGNIGAKAILRREIERMTVIKYVERHYGIPHQCLRLDSYLSVRDLRNTIIRNAHGDYSAPVITLVKEERFYWQIVNNYNEKGRTPTSKEQRKNKMDYYINEVIKSFKLDE